MKHETRGSRTMTNLRRRSRSLTIVLGLVLALTAGLHASRATDGAPVDDKAKTGASASAPGSDADSTAEQGPASYPISSVLPVARDFAQTIRGFGTVKADARTVRAITSANQIVVTAVHVIQGERVKRGQPLFGTEPDPAVHLAYQQALSAARLARREVDRLTAQRADSLATESQVETAQKALTDASAGVEAARRLGADSASAAIVAPVDGVVVSIGVVTGDRPAVGTPLAQIAPNAARVSVGIEPGERRQVHVGDKVTVRAVQTTDPPLAGRIAVVGAALDPDSRLVNVAIDLNAGAGEALISGQAIEAAIEVQRVRAYSLPRAAVLRDGSDSYVYEVRERKAHRVAVSIISDEGARVGVTGDLAADRPVVTTGAYQLDDGVSVEEHRP